jgi:hypothetical protein
MGSFVVVVRAGDFILRAKSVIEALGYTYNSTWVEYFDPAIFHGQFPLKEMAFKKRSKFSFRSEYRICVDTRTNGDDVVWIEIGNISDLCAKMPAADVNVAATFVADLQGRLMAIMIRLWKY